MSKMKTWVGLGIVGLLVAGGPVSARNNGPTLQDRQQAACYGDVQKLCGNFIPDVTKTENCMKDKRSMVSKKCSDMWDVKD